jgi:hypothetical protein
MWVSPAINSSTFAGLKGFIERGVALKFFEIHGKWLYTLTVIIDL